MLITNFLLFLASLLGFYHVSPYPCLPSFIDLFNGTLCFPPLRARLCRSLSLISLSVFSPLSHLIMCRHLSSLLSSIIGKFASFRTIIHEIWMNIDISLIVFTSVCRANFLSNSLPLSISPFVLLLLGKWLITHSSEFFSSVQWIELFHILSCHPSTIVKNPLPPLQ